MARTSIISCAIVMLLACESSNYAPPVTPQLASADSRGNKAAQIALLQEGRALFVHRCIECHTLPIIWHYTMKDWDEIIGSMSHRASLKGSEREAILIYIRAARSQ